MSLVERIKKLCEENGTSIPKLEAEMGFARGSIYNWDDHSPSVVKVAAVARRFKVSIDSLIGRELNPTKKEAAATATEKGREEIAALRELTAPIVEWIRENHSPHTEVHISWDHVWVRHDGIGIPFPYSDE